MTIVEPADEVLVKLVLGGERENFAVLVDRYKRGISNFIGASVRSQADVADLAQETFLRSYAQKNPKQEYKREAFELFSAMLDRIKFDTLTTLSKIQVRSQAELDREENERQQRLARALQAQHAEAISPIQTVSGVDEDPRPPAPPAAPFVRPMPKVGRNEPCPCGSGRKYKHCHGALQQASG